MVITEPAIPLWVRNSILTTFNACSTKILLDSHADCFQVRKIEHASERAYFYHIVNIVTENRQRRATFSYIEV